MCLQGELETSTDESEMTVTINFSSRRFSSAELADDANAQTALAEVVASHAGMKCGKKSNRQCVKRDVVIISYADVVARRSDAVAVTMAVKTNDATAATTITSNLEAYMGGSSFTRQI